MARPSLAGFAAEAYRNPLEFTHATRQGEAAVLHLALERVRLNRLVQRRDEAVAVDWLLDIVVRAAAQTLERQVIFTMTRDHDGRGVRPARKDFCEEREAVHSGHLDISDDRIVVALGDALERRHRRVDRFHDDAAHSEAQRLGKRLQQSRVIVDDENARLVVGRLGDLL